MLLLQIAFGLFGLLMLVRHLTLAVRALRSSEPDRLGRAAVHFTNVLLALAILGMAVLVVAVTGGKGSLISR